MAPVLAVDIGGTNMRLVIYDEKYTILYRENHETGAVADFHELINDFLEHAKNDVKEDVENGCFAIAGPVKVIAGRNRVEMTNAHLIIDETLIERNTKLKHARVINDFTAIGYSVNVLKGKDCKLLRKGKAVSGEPKVVVGAGTGLGIAILVPKNDVYEPIKSEGGHADLPFSPHEVALCHEAYKVIKGPVSYENFLSGSGVELIYNTLRKLYHPSVKPGLTAAEIFGSKDHCSQETIKQFITFYARCAKNYSLAAFALGGVYIAGGIAEKNANKFSGFLVEFDKHALKTYRDILKEIPIRIITNPDVGLLGAAYAARLVN